MHTSQQNFTIVVNWKKSGFGRAKACSYCNWRTSPYLPHGGQDPSAISAFIRQCKKSFITISGGADPLYKFGENRDQLLSMVQTIRAHGFRVRIITREVQHIAELKGMVDLVSISLDSDVLAQLPSCQPLWAGIDVEYSLVLPPIPTADITLLKPQYEALRKIVNGPLILRENLNSIYPLDLTELSFGHRGIVFVPKQLCLNGRYLSTIDSTGHELVQDNERLAAFLMDEPEIFLFGGFLRHIVNPALHMEYDDIDVIALSTDVMDRLSSDFSFTFTRTSPSGSYPRYYQGRSAKAGKAIQLILMNSASDALRFVHNSQYDVDRIGYSARTFYFDPEVGREATLAAINSKRVSRLHGPRSMDLFSADRPLIEQRHRAKLLRKSFLVLN